jgi:hypothetical protein
VVGGGAFGRRVRRAWARLGRREETGDPVGDFRAPRHDVSDANSTRRFGPRVRSPTTRVGWVLVKRRTVTFVDDRMPRAFFFSPSCARSSTGCRSRFEENRGANKIPLSLFRDLSRPSRDARGRRRRDGPAPGGIFVAGAARVAGRPAGPPDILHEPAEGTATREIRDMATLLAEGVSSLPFPSPGSSSRASRSCA